MQGLCKNLEYLLPATLKTRTRKFNCCQDRTTKFQGADENPSGRYDEEMESGSKNMEMIQVNPGNEESYDGTELLLK